MTRRGRAGLLVAMRADRIIAAAQRVRTGRRAAKTGRRFAGQTGRDRPARPCRTLGLEREAFAPAIAFGGIAGRKPQLDLRQRVAATGPAGEGIGFGGSEERRVGEGGVRTWRFRGGP